MRPTKSTICTTICLWSGKTWPIGACCAQVPQHVAHWPSRILICSRSSRQCERAYWVLSQQPCCRSLIETRPRCSGLRRRGIVPTLLYVLALTMTLVVSPAVAGPQEEADAAYARGDY